jgi:hypothetical protein
MQIRNVIHVLVSVVVASALSLAVVGCKSRSSRASRGHDAASQPVSEHHEGEHPTSEHPQGEHPTAEHPKAEHPKAEHPTSEHPEHPQ